MTFKHTDFGSSEVMRSLEKVAQHKGLVKPQPFIKAAANKVDLAPTTNLTDNVLKLCAGLRERGFVKQADELEVYLINYKKAQTLYETSPEKGEDLVQAAHPKGSHKLEGVDSDEAVFEDILDQMAKALTMVNKKPTGKLSNAKQAIADVKQVFAQDQAVLEKKIQYDVNRVVAIVNRIGDLIKNEITFYYDFTRSQNLIKEDAANPTSDNLKNILKVLNTIKIRFEPGSWVTLGLGGMTEDTWAKVEPLLNAAKTSTIDAINTRNSLNEISGKQEVGDFDAGTPQETKPLQLNPSIGKLSNLVDKLNAYKSVQTVAKNRSALNWIGQEIGEIRDLMNRINSIPKGQETSVMPALDKEVMEKEKEVTDFATSWVGV